MAEPRHAPDPDPETWVPPEPDENTAHAGHSFDDEYDEGVEEDRS